MTTNEANTPGNTQQANWKVYFASTLNATASSPTILQTVASDHFNHGADISLAGFVVGGPNRNLADFFQVAIDPLGHAFIAYTDDSQDFAGHTWVTHQVQGPSLHTGKMTKVHGKEPKISVDTTQPEVLDWRHDARVDSRPPTQPEVDTPADILSVDYACYTGPQGLQVGATIRASGLDTLPPNGVWRMNFSTNPTKPGLSDRADQWFVVAETGPTGTVSYSWGTASRNTDGTLSYHEARTGRRRSSGPDRPIHHRARGGRQAQRRGDPGHGQERDRRDRPARDRPGGRQRSRRRVVRAVERLDPRGPAARDRPVVQELLERMPNAECRRPRA